MPRTPIILQETTSFFLYLHENIPIFQRKNSYISYNIFQLLAGRPVAGNIPQLQVLMTDNMHWLPVQQWIIFKIDVLAFKYMHNTGPIYFNDGCAPLADIPRRSTIILLIIWLRYQRKPSQRLQ